MMLCSPCTLHTHKASESFYKEKWSHWGNNNISNNHNNTATYRNQQPDIFIAGNNFFKLKQQITFIVDLTEPPTKKASAKHFVCVCL